LLHRIGTAFDVLISFSSFGYNIGILFSVLFLILSIGIGISAVALTLSSSEISSIWSRHIDPAILGRLRPKIETFIRKSQRAGRRPRLDTLNQIAILYAYGSPSATIIGPSTLVQLAESIAFLKQLESQDIESPFRQIVEMIQ
jgi:hypothetical protein